MITNDKHLVVVQGSWKDIEQAIKKQTENEERQVSDQ